MKKVVAGGLAAAVLAIAAPVIMHFEGRELTAYEDAVGVPTICDGITAGVQLGDQATPEQCDELLQQEMSEHFAGLRRCVEGELSPNQWAALLSWTYNVGVGAACGSTLVALINQGEGAHTWCPELKRWVYAGGRKLRGLVRRRQAEYEICVR